MFSVSTVEDSLESQTPTSSTDVKEGLDSTGLKMFGLKWKVICWKAHLCF